MKVSAGSVGACERNYCRLNDMIADATTFLKPADADARERAPR